MCLVASPNLRFVLLVGRRAMALGQNNSMAPDMAKAKSAIESIFTLIDVTPSVNTASEDGAKMPVS